MNKHIIILIFLSLIGMSAKANNITFTPTSQNVTVNSGEEIEVTVDLNLTGSQPNGIIWFINTNQIPDNGYISHFPATGTIYVGDAITSVTFRFNRVVTATTNSTYKFRYDWSDEVGNPHNGYINITVTYTFNDPDSDGDGIPDSQDDCPNQAGPASNNGCPTNTSCSIGTVTSFWKNYTSPTKLGFDWNNKQGNNGYVLQYRKYVYGVPEDSNWTSIHLPINTTNYQLTNLFSDSRYQTRIAAKCANGNLGPWDSLSSLGDFRSFRTYANCPEDYSLTNTTQQYPSYGNIQSTYLINANNSINFSGYIDSRLELYSGISIVLNPGFRMTDDSTLLAKIQDCSISANQRPQNEDNVKIVKEQINLYPNPTKNKIEITSSEKIINWQVYDKYGKLLFQNQNKFSNKIEVNLSNYSRDIYIINMTLKSGKRIIRKMIKE